MSFLELTKQARYEELREQVREALSAPWTWERLLALLDALGVRDADGFLAAGWWLPAEARIHQEQVDVYAAEAERAMAEGVIPEPGRGYSWGDVRALLERCRIEPARVVDGLLWVYANTLGEAIFLDTLRRMAPDGSEQV